MHEIVVEPAIEKEFASLAGQAVVCDANGRVLGVFSPWPNRPRIGDLNLEPPLSIAELEELRKNPDGQAA
jgi:hypothetical protein